MPRYSDLGSMVDKKNTEIPRKSCDNNSHDLLKPSKLCNQGNLILLINGDHIKLNATIKPPKESKPISDKSRPSTLNHLESAAPVTKYGREADIPKKIKLIGSFLNIF